MPRSRTQKGAGLRGPDVALSRRKGRLDRGVLIGISGSSAVAAGIAIAMAIALVGPEVVLLMAIAAIALVVAAVLPGVTFALYLLIPLYKGALQPMVPIDLTLILAVVNAAQVLPVLAQRRPRRLSNAGLVLWALMALLVVAGVLYAPDDRAAFGRAIMVWLLVFLPLIPAAIRVGSEEQFLRQSVLTFVAAGLLTIIVAVPSLSSAGRVTVLDANTIQTARAALLVPLLAMLFVPQVRSAAARLVVVAVCIGAVLVALASGSRGPIIMVLIIGAVGFLRSVATSGGPDRRAMTTTGGLALLAIAILASGAIDIPDASLEQFTGFGDFVGSVVGLQPGGGIEDTSSGVRLDLLGFAVKLFEQAPIFGVGTAGYAELSPAALGDFEANAYPHNAIFQVASEHGIVGLVIFGSLVTLALIRRLPDRTYGHAVRLLFIYYLLNAMVSGELFDDRAIWGLLALLLLMDPAVRPDAVDRPTDHESSPPAWSFRPPLPWPVAPVDRPAERGPYAIP